MSMEFKCPSCGKKQFSYEIRERRFERIVKTCKSCNAQYLDPRCHELAVEGIPADAFKISPYLLMLVLGLLVAWRGYYLFGRQELGTPQEVQWLMPTVFLCIGIACAIGAVIGIIRIKTGSKAKSFDRLMNESKQRMRDETYVRSLRDLGYPLPQEYTIGLREGDTAL